MRGSFQRNKPVISFFVMAPSVRESVVKNTKIVFVLGGATLLMVASLAGATGFNGKWDDDNKYVNNQYGRQRDIHNVALGIIVCSLVSAIFFLIAGATVMICPASRAAHLGLYIVAMIIFFGAAAAEILGLVWTWYGDTMIYSVYNYYDKDADFKKYVDTYTEEYPERYGAFFNASLTQFQGQIVEYFCNNTERIMNITNIAGPNGEYTKQVTQIKLAMNMPNWATQCPTLAAQGGEEFQAFMQYATTLMLGVMGVNLDPTTAMSITDPVPKAVNQILTLLYTLNLTDIHVQVPGSDSDPNSPSYIDWSNFMQPYYQFNTTKKEYELKYISPVALNWTGMILDSTLIGSDPCIYLFDDKYEWDAIGGWSADQFKKVWCWNYRKQIVAEKEWNPDGKRSAEEIQKREAQKSRQEQGSDSLTAFYQCNSILLGLQVAAFIVVFIALCVHAATIKRLDFAYKPMANENEV